MLKKGILTIPKCFWKNKTLSLSFIKLISRKHMLYALLVNQHQHVRWWQKSWCKMHMDALIWNYMQLKMTFWSQIWILQNGGFGFSASKIFLKRGTLTTQRSSLYNPQCIPLTIFLDTPHFCCLELASLCSFTNVMFSIQSISL